MASLQTGQQTCHDACGREMRCAGSGQDAEFSAGAPWPQPRFEAGDQLVLDRLTGLVWTRDANPAEFPLTWQEALAFVARMNRDGALGFSDWRLPNRRELRSLMSHQTRRPALPAGHPFRNVFAGWVWTSTSAAIGPAHAWYVHLEGARMFYGGKDQSFLVWPARGAGNGILPATGQERCFDDAGREIPCGGSGQDGETRNGRAWPTSRFAVEGEAVRDHLTGLGWQRCADLTGSPVNWDEALAAVAELNRAEPERAWSMAPAQHQRARIPGGLRVPQPGPASGPSFRRRAARLLVFHHQHLRARLGVGLVPRQRRRRRRPEERAAFSRLGGVRRAAILIALPRVARKESSDGVVLG